MRSQFFVSFYCTIYLLLPCKTSNCTHKLQSKPGDIFAFAIVCAEVLNMRPVYESGAGSEGGGSGGGVANAKRTPEGL